MTYKDKIKFDPNYLSVLGLDLSECTVLTKSFGANADTFKVTEDGIIQSQEATYIESGPRIPQTSNVTTKMETGQKLILRVN